MPPNSAGPPPALYAAFDVFPSPKGAATHIGQFADALFTAAGGGVLYVLGGPEHPAHQLEGPPERRVRIARFNTPIAGFLDRTVAFGARLAGLLDRWAPNLSLAHFRDPWSGVPIVADPRRGFATVYEVNGLPSIELPHAWPRVGPRTVRRVRALEAQCWQAADALVVPSPVTAERLVTLGVDAQRITVIPNGADVEAIDAAAACPRPAEAPERYLLYFGALQPWQGVDTLLRAFARLADQPDLRLVIISATRRGRARPLHRLAERLALTERVQWRYQRPRAEVWRWAAHAELSVAPLTACARNVEQGCSPLKIIESLAAGTPVVASDLPAVRAVMRDRVHGRLVPPDRPEALARALRVLLELPDVRAEMARAGRAHVAERHRWRDARAALTGLYHRLGLDGAGDGDPPSSVMTPPAGGTQP